MCLAREKESGEKYRAILWRCKKLRIKDENQVAEAVNFALIRSMIISQVERGGEGEREGGEMERGRRRGLKSRRRLDYRARRGT